MKTHSKSRIVLNIEDTIHTLEYWIGIEECVCSSPYPQGSCLLCDLKEIQKLIIDLESEKNDLLSELKKSV